jgi:hypothetical protein
MKSSLKMLIGLGCVATIVCALAMPSFAGGHGGGFAGSGYHGGYGYHGGCGYRGCYGYRCGWGFGVCCTPWPFVYAPCYGPVYTTGYDAPAVYAPPAYAEAPQVGAPMPGDPAPAAVVSGANPPVVAGIADASGAATTTATVYDAPQGAYVAQQPAPAPPPVPVAAPVYVQQSGRTTVYVSAPAPAVYAAPAYYYPRPVYYYRPTYYTYAPYYYRPGVAVIVR